jgi:uncharacterized membrane protein YgcG
MRRMLSLAVLATLLVASPFPWGPQALAVVEDTAGSLSPAEAQALDRRLAQLGPHRFDVLIAESAPGGAVAEARRLFAERNLGPSDGAIVVTMGDRQVGVHLGDAFASRGVDGAAIQRAIATRFALLARQGNMAGAVSGLAAGLVQAGARQDGSPVGAAPVDQAPGFPWWLLIPVGAGAFWFLRRRGGKAGAPAAGDLAARVRTLRTRQNQLLEGALKLDEASRLGRFAAGATADTYSQLASRAGSILSETGAFGDRLDEADALLKHGKRAEAHAIVQALESEVLPLSSEVAAAVTGVDAMGDDDQEARNKLASARARMAALSGRGVPPAHLAPLEARLADGDRLLKETDPMAALIVAEEVHQGLDRLEGRIVTIEPAVAWAALPDQAEALAGRLQAMRETYRALQERSEAIGLGADPMLENHLDVAERALTTAPVSLPRAQAAMTEAQEALKGYIHRVETESDRRATFQAQQQSTTPMGGFGGWMPGPIILLNDFGSHAHPGGFSGGGDWGGGGGGFGGGGDWGGGSSGGGDW